MLNLEDAITFIRRKLVPDCYSPYPFRADTPESLLDKLGSVVATYQFRCDIQYWKNKGVHFSQYLYVPEIDPITGDILHERSDHNHLLKRIAKATREGNNSDLNYERFDEAMRNPMTGCTRNLPYAILVSFWIIISICQDKSPISVNPRPKQYIILGRLEIT